jgi:integrase
MTTETMRGRGWIEKREGPNGTTFRARYRLNGSTISETFAARDDADGWLAKQKVEHRERRWVSPEDAARPFAEWLDDWHATRDLRPSTEARDRSLMDNHLRPHLGALAIGDLSQTDVVRWVTSLRRDKGLAPSTVRECYRILAASMRAAAAGKVISETPCVEIPLPQKTHNEIRFLTEVELERLADAVEPRFRALVLLGGWGGLRFSEMTALTPKRLDLLRGEVEVVEAVSWVNGRSDVGPTKTRAGRRRVGLPPSVVRELADHLERFEPRSYVFESPREDVNLPLRPGAFRRGPWKRAAKAAGLDPAPRIHDLRHTAISLWIAQGADVKHISARAGHTSVSFTLDRYGHLYPDRDEGLRIRLDELRDQAKAANAESGNVVALPRLGSA